MLFELALTGITKGAINIGLGAVPREDSIGQIVKDDHQ